MVKKKWPIIKVEILDDAYDAKVTVLRHVSEPEEVCVYIEGITPRSPRPLADSADGVMKVVQGGQGTVKFNIDTTYPHEN